MTQKTKKAFRQETIETMDRHAKTVSVLFHEYMHDNSCKTGADMYELRLDHWEKLYTLSESYDIFVEHITGTGKDEHRP